MHFNFISKIMTHYFSMGSIWIVQLSTPFKYSIVSFEMSGLCGMFFLENLFFTNGTIS